MLTRIVGVHGIQNHHYYRRTGSAAAATETISADWTNWLRAGLPDGVPVDLRVSYYSHHLHRGTPQGVDDDPSTLEPEAQDLLISWVAQLQPRPATAHGPRTAGARQAADWITRHYGPAGRAFVVAFCREVETYLARPDSPRRIRARETVADAIAEHRPSVVIAHSLGSVVTYEALWAHPELSVDLLVTLGSPLGMPHAIFDRLLPTPANGKGRRPPGAKRWANLADIGDIVAIPSDLPSLFEGIDLHRADLTIAPWDFHSTRNYLTCPAVIDVLLPHLSDEKGDAHDAHETAFDADRPIRPRQGWRPIG